MKSTKVQTLGELCMRDTANGWAGLGWAIGVYSQSPASSSRRVSHRLATVVDRMRELIHTLHCGFMCLQGTQSKQIRSRWASILRWSRQIYACAPLIDGLGHATLSATVLVCRSRTQSFQKNRHFVFLARVPLTLLVSLISRLVACSAKTVVDTQTETQNNYRNPRCACAPRVN